MANTYHDLGHYSFMHSLDIHCRTEQFLYQWSAVTNRIIRLFMSFQIRICAIHVYADSNSKLKILALAFTREVNKVPV